MIRALALAAAASLTSCAAIPRPSTPAPAPLPPCVGAVIVAEHGQALGCDATPPQRIDETGATRETCDRDGGTFEAPDVCRDLDY